MGRGGPGWRAGAEGQGRTAEPGKAQLGSVGELLGEERPALGRRGFPGWGRSEPLGADPGPFTKCFRFPRAHHGPSLLKALMSYRGNVSVIKQSAAHEALGREAYAALTTEDVGTVKGRA